VLAKRLGLARWKDKGPKALAARLREYERIGNELDSELPAVKPIKPKAPAKGAAGPGFARGDVFRIPLVTGPENFGYFRVVDLIGPKGKLDVIAELLKIPPPNASLEHDFKQSFVQAVRRPQFASEPWRMALRLSGTIRKGLGLERIANVELVLDYSFQRHSKWAAYDCAEAEWNDLPEIARWSFDSLKFLDDAEVVAIARATEPGETSGAPRPCWSWLGSSAPTPTTPAAGCWALRSTALVARPRPRRCGRGRLRSARPRDGPTVGRRSTSIATLQKRGRGCSRDACRAYAARQRLITSSRQFQGASYPNRSTGTIGSEAPAYALADDHR